MTENESKKRRERGTGYIYQRGDRWYAKLTIGVKADGKPNIKYLSGKSEAEVKRKVREYNVQNDPGARQRITVEQYVTNWLKVYKQGELKASSFDRLESTIRSHIIPNIGNLQLAQVKSDDLQMLINQLRENGLSHSSVKKVYDALNSVFIHATAQDDVVRNPMLVVRMPGEATFEKKEIRWFSHAESALIIEECMRVYRTGKRVYPYGDCFILMLHTGLRMGELIALRKIDWNREKSELYVRRNAQAVRNRDENGERVAGKQTLVLSSTKTYSGRRVIPLSNGATEALERLCEASADSKYIATNTKGEIIPQERFERSFYRILKNCGLEQTGTHSLRHTFASTLFEAGENLSTISHLLGHASTKITETTYIHMMHGLGYENVAALDEVF